MRLLDSLMQKTNRRLAARSLISVFCFGCLIGCAAQESFDAKLSLENLAYLPAANLDIEIPMLSNCTNSDDTNLKLNTQEPVTVIVHGCFSSAGRFNTLADVFAFHGQQTVCFNYDDRDSLEVSSAQLITAVEALADVLDEPEIQVLGHSQGGLIARRAFIQERPDQFVADVDVNLTTISAPFSGIDAASHCGMKSLAWLSLGLVKPICRLVTGPKYKDINPKSQFVLDPGRLTSSVDQHLAISTDEVGSCRVSDEAGVCIEDDFVFSLEEQSLQPSGADERSSQITVTSGHVEIVGDSTNVPTQLIEILQQEGIMRETPAQDRDDLAALLQELYLDPGTRVSAAVR